MSEHPRSEYRAVGAARFLIHRFAYAGLILAAAGLMMLGKVDAVLMERVRLHVSDTVAPVLDVASQPAVHLARVVDEVRSWTALHDDNARLRQDRDRLLHWQAAARRLEMENAVLRGLLNFTPDPAARYVTARVIADAGGAFAHSLLLSAGREAGVGKGHAVVTGDGLVGRISGVGSRVARVLLITVLNSRIPVFVGPDRVRAILAGDNSADPKLIYLAPETVVAPGERVVTSGDAGAFPSGLPIGVVGDVREGDISVQPFTDRSSLEYVRVVDYGLPGILRNPRALEAHLNRGEDDPTTAGETGKQTASRAQ